MLALKEYLKIRRKILFRYWNDFPLILKLFSILVVAVLIAVLFYVKLEIKDIKTIGIASGIFVLIALNLSLEKSHKILLNNYGISIRKILLIRTGLLTIPFFILNPLIGLICLILAIIISIARPKKISIKRTLFFFRPTFCFKKGSYQWLSFYRQVGIYVFLGCIFLIIMGILHGNDNLLLVVYALLGLVTGLASIVLMEPAYFVKTYLSPMGLIKKKTLEIIINISIIMIPLGGCLSFFSGNITYIISFYGMVVLLSCVNVACKYICYPDKIKYSIFSPVLIFIVSLSFVFGYWSIFFILPVLIFLYYKMYIHLQKFFLKGDK